MGGGDAPKFLQHQDPQFFQVTTFRLWLVLVMWARLVLTHEMFAVSAQRGLGNGKTLLLARSTGAFPLVAIRRSLAAGSLVGGDVRPALREG